MEINVWKKLLVFGGSERQNESSTEEKTRVVDTAV
jgi:hypothetical protein